MYAYVVCVLVHLSCLFCVYTHRVLFIVGSLCQMLTIHFSLLVHPLNCWFVVKVNGTLQSFFFWLMPYDLYLCVKERVIVAQNIEAVP